MMFKRFDKCRFLSVKSSLITTWRTTKNFNIIRAFCQKFQFIFKRWHVTTQREALLSDKKYRICRLVMHFNFVVCFKIQSILNIIKGVYAQATRMQKMFLHAIFLPSENLRKRYKAFEHKEQHPLPFKRLCEHSNLLNCLERSWNTSSAAIVNVKTSYLYALLALLKLFSTPFKPW